LEFSIISAERKETIIEFFSHIPFSKKKSHIFQPGGDIMEMLIFYDFLCNPGYEFLFPCKKIFPHFDEKNFQNIEPTEKLNMILFQNQTKVRPLKICHVGPIFSE